MAARQATAKWEGTLKEGNGTMHLRQGGWEGPYTFSSRFEEGEGTNPEELIAAAHAGCFSMAAAGDLGRAGIDVERVETRATVDLRMVDGKPTITKVTLTTEVTAPGGDEAKIREAVEGAKEGCPVSRALAAVDEIALDLTINT
ncbi:MAG TPA: OsmC family peroxiredoxin [Solirubrobacteraceae bacterium]|nr:OsmC family peroxiredoxin [Solirubrobacteraceae bacterium]